MIDIIIFWAIMGSFVFLAHWALAGHRTLLERQEIINLVFNCTGDHWRDASTELDEVTYGDHVRRRLIFKRRDVLYGPLIQELMLYNHLGRLEDNEFFWLCYEDVYRRKLNKRETRKVNEMIAQYGPSNLPMALEYLGHNLPEYNPPPKFVMAEAASEYDEIISMQESVNGSSNI